MTLYSTKSLTFKDDSGNKFTVRNLTITPDAPEWIKKTTTYKHAIADGCLNVVDSKEKKIAAENGDLAKPKKKVVAE